MFKSSNGLVAAITTITLSLGGTNALAAESQETRDLNNYLCKDLMRLSGEDRDIAVALVHGYRLGKKNTTQFNTEALAKITDSFIEYCLDHPGEKAMVAFEKLTKSSGSDDPPSTQDAGKQ